MELGLYQLKLKAFGLEKCQPIFVHSPFCPPNGLICPNNESLPFVGYNYKNEKGMHPRDACRIMNTWGAMISNHWCG